jgi:hypothetical protein
MTEPAVGASTCASGNQICIGIVGILIEKAKYIHSHKINSLFVSI